MLGISRPALHDVLSKAATRLGATVSSITQSQQSVTVHCTYHIEKTYDLVIGADGLYSKARAMTFAEQCVPQYTGQAVWRYNGIAGASC